METEGKRILVNYLTDIADTFRSITGETDTISAESFAKEVQTVAASSSKNSYQRRSIDEMNAITDMKEGDTCLVLQNNVSQITSDEKAVRVITFPKEVIFETPIKGRFDAKIQGENISGDIRLFSSSFSFICSKKGLGRVEIRYHSKDRGRTYTLTSHPGTGSGFNEEGFIITDNRSVDFKTNITITGANEYIGAFLYGAELSFEGIWQYFNGVWNIQSLGYDLLKSDVNVTKDYYNNGKQHGVLGGVDTAENINVFNNFMQERCVNVKYPTDMSFAFKDCVGEKIPLLELSSDTSGVTNMNHMFSGCQALTSIPSIDTSQVTNMDYMFSGCQALTSIPSIDTSQVTNMSYLFDGCRSLQQIPLLDTSRVTDMSGIFNKCTSLITVPQFDTSKVTMMAGMFYGCDSLKTIPELDASSAVHVWEIFETLAPIENFGGLKNLGYSYSIDEDANYPFYELRLDHLTKLTHESLMNVINNLYDIKSKGVKQQSLWLGDTNKAKLTAEEIAIATNKGWNVK